MYSESSGGSIIAYIYHIKKTTGSKYNTAYYHKPCSGEPRKISGMIGASERFIADVFVEIDSTLEPDWIFA